MRPTAPSSFLSSAHGVHAHPETREKLNDQNHNWRLSLMIQRPIRMIASICATIPLLIFIVQCGSGVSSSVQPTQRTTWIPCTSSLLCDIPVTNPKGHRPLCATTGYCGTDNFCAFVETPGTTCFPPDVAFCDLTDGGHPECNELDGSWPQDASACGTLTCVVESGAPPTCNWSTACLPP